MVSDVINSDGESDVTQGRKSNGYRGKSHIQDHKSDTFSIESQKLRREQNRDDYSDYGSRHASTKSNVLTRNGMWYLQIAMGLIIGIAIGYTSVELFKKDIRSPAVQDKSSKQEFSLLELRSKYSNVKTKVFDELEAAVQLIKSKGSPLSLVFPHHTNDVSVTKTTSFLTDVAILASKYLGNGKVFNISSESLETAVQEDYGTLLTVWRPQIEEGHVMLVLNLQQVPAQVAPVFHTLCDEWTPYVNRSLYLHTIDMGDDARDTETWSVPVSRAAVERRLRQSWPDMNDEVFDPLLARIAGSVLLLD